MHPAPLSRPGRLPFAALLLALTLAAGCAGPRERLDALREPEVTRAREMGPPGAPPDSCWGKYVTPAIIETVTHQVMLQPPQVRSDGTVLQPAIYKTETRQDIVRERRETWFETPCPEALTEDLVASVQRALAVRGHYHGPVNGQMDARTRAAVRRFQAPQGLDSGLLSLAGARQLGLVAIDLDH